LSQINSFQLGSFKNWNINNQYSQSLLRLLKSSKSIRYESISELPKKINHWNLERLEKRKIEGLPQDLSTGDISDVRILIQEAVDKSSMRSTKVFSDQLFFLTVGAIQIQSQTGSEKSWELLNQFVQSNINAKADRRVLLSGLLVGITMAFMAAINQTSHNSHSISNISDNPLIQTSGSTADLVTISMLQLAYNKMKSGTCQLPQAAMLPDQQRNAFLLFVNKGTIDINDVENLRQAFGYVNCLYPQELMRPQLPI
jgi:hypothetical protein